MIAIQIRKLVPQGPAHLFQSHQVVLADLAFVGKRQRFVQRPGARPVSFQPRLKLLEHPLGQHSLQLADANVLAFQGRKKFFNQLRGKYLFNRAAEFPELQRLLDGNGRLLETRHHRPSRQNLERETGIEPATNSLEGCDSTTELLPPSPSAVLLRLPTNLLEPMTRIELVTSPLPRECSTN